MSVFNALNPHIFLNFNEVNIISENRMFKEKDAFTEHLHSLCANTTDPILLYELQELTGKINKLNDEEFTLLLKDAEEGTLLFPPNYTLPNLSDVSF